MVPSHKTYRLQLPTSTKQNTTNYVLLTRKFRQNFCIFSCTACNARYYTPLTNRAVARIFYKWGSLGAHYECQGCLVDKKAQNLGLHANTSTSMIKFKFFCRLFLAKICCKIFVLFTYSYSVISWKKTSRILENQKGGSNYFLDRGSSAIQNNWNFSYANASNHTFMNISMAKTTVNT